jgi:hypothetical protein
MWTHVEPPVLKAAVQYERGVPPARLELATVQFEKLSLFQLSYGGAAPAAARNGWYPFLAAFCSYNFISINLQPNWMLSAMPNISLPKTPKAGDVACFFRF